jgi:hypothetical protein
LSSNTDHYKNWVNSGASERLAVPASCTTPAMLQCLKWGGGGGGANYRNFWAVAGALLHSELKQVMSLFTLGSARAVLVVALVYSFPDVFNVIMALISPYTNQPFIDNKNKNNNKKRSKNNKQCLK